MASKSGFGDRFAEGSIRKLKSNPDDLLEEAHKMEAYTATESELAQARLQSLLSQHLLRPATINSIEVHGAKNTRKTFLDPLIKPLVADGRNEDTTLGDVLDRISTLTNKLDRFDIFHPSPRVYFSDARASDPQAAATDLDVSIRVAEKSRLVFKAGTDVGNTEGSAYTNALLRNIFGGGETVSVNASVGTRTRSAYSAVFSTPINSNPDVVLTAEALSSTTQKPWASHEEVLKNGSLRLAWLTGRGPRQDAHSIAYSGAWRQITGLPANASPTVRADAGDSVKSSLTHTFTRDRRDNPLLPQSGYLLRSVLELAGVGPLSGDVAFSKNELEVSGALPIPLPGFPSGTRTGVSLGGGLRLGLLYPLPLGYNLSGPAQPSRVPDRFQLGGPTDVRGFRLGGLGPHDGRDAVGGDVFAAGSVNLLTPLPGTKGAESPLRLQLFANGGRLVALTNRDVSARGRGAEQIIASGGTMTPRATWIGMKDAVGELLYGGLPSMAAGVGLVYAHPMARFELNFSLPLVLRKGEEGRKGLQVGVGINFM